MKIVKGLSIIVSVTVQNPHFDSCERRNLVFPRVFGNLDFEEEKFGEFGMDLKNLIGKMME